MLDFESARRRFIEVAARARSEAAAAASLSESGADNPARFQSGPQSSSANRETERVVLEHAVGRVLGAALIAKRASPPFDMSAMDGYAVRTDDVASLPYGLRVEGEAVAGAPSATLSPGTAMRIVTGAPLPSGADAVVMQEHVQRDAQTIRGDSKVMQGQYVRACGEDLTDGAVALERGQRLRATSLALAGFLEYAELEVTRSPRVNILMTGNELHAPGSAASTNGIAESNSAVIATLARQAGATVTGCRIVEDDAARIHREIEAALQASDVLITVGGSSVGDYDCVGSALEAAGVIFELCKVAMKPGKPITLGRRGGRLVIGLPGNPASAVTAFALFAMPLLRAIQGDIDPLPHPCWIPLVTALHRDLERTRVILGNLRMYLGETGFLAHANQASGATVALGSSDGFVVLEPGTEPVEAGTRVPFYRWSDL
jgi:molybdopterin molybdotransferase